MPFPIVKRGKQYCVISEDSGKTHGCHPLRKDARQQQKAMYRNVPEARQKKEKK